MMKTNKEHVPLVELKGRRNTGVGTSAFLSLFVTSITCLVAENKQSQFFSFIGQQRNAISDDCYLLLLVPQLVRCCNKIHSGGWSCETCILQRLQPTGRNECRKLLLQFLPDSIQSFCMQKKTGVCLPKT